MWYNPFKNSVKISLNDKIKVKLTEKGKKIYFEHIKNCNERISERYKIPSVLKIDKKGYTMFQLWDFMKMYGEYMLLGEELPCDCEVIIDKSN